MTQSVVLAVLFFAFTWVAFLLGYYVAELRLATRMDETWRRLAERAKEGPDEMGAA